MPSEISVAVIYAMWIAGELGAQGANIVSARRKEVRTGAMTQVAEETQQMRKAQRLRRAKVRARIMGRGISPGGSVKRSVFEMKPTIDVQRRRWPPPGVTLSRCRLLGSSV